MDFSSSDRLERLLDLYGVDYQAVATARVLARITACESLLIFGAGQNGRLLLRLLRAAGLTPRAFVDETPGKAGQAVDDLPVIDLAATQGLPRALAVVSVFTPKIGYLDIAGRLRAQQIETLSLFETLWAFGGEPFYFLDHPRVLQAARPQLLRLAGLLQDAASFELLLESIEFRASLRYEVLPTWSPQRARIPTSWASVSIVDAGAYDGDTLLPFVRDAGDRLATAIALEPDSGNYEKLSANLRAAKCGAQVRALCAAVGERSERRGFSSLGHQGSRFEADALLVDTVAIDDLAEHDLPASARLYIKLDVEGAEAEAIVGCRKTIAERSPMLAIAAYHRPTDLWDLAERVLRIDPSYRFRLAAHGADGADLTLYAIPRK